jgi:hypothetical protein
MSTLFIAHADEDYPFISPLARDLECAGYRCWFYERDSFAGTSYLIQEYAAIQQADVFILIASDDSLKSHNVTREVEQAHQRQRLPLLTVLRAIDADQIKNRQPIWNMVLGTTVYVNAARTYDVAVRDRIVAGLQSMNLTPADGPIRNARTLREPHAAKTIARKHLPSWASDGTQIRPKFVKEVLFLSEKVKEIIEADQRFLFISGEKGLGKTLLLSYKRSYLSEQHEQHGDAEHPARNVTFIPEDRPYLDLMTDLPTLTRKHERFLANARNSKRVWAFAIRIAVVSQFQDKLREAPLVERSRWSRLSEFCLQGKKSPTEVFRELVSLSINDLNQFLEVSEIRLEQLFRQVRNAVFLFIDKVDQGIRGLPKDAWINVQGGLLEASWDCTSTNPHVRVFGTIRDEAFANYESELKGNLQNAVLSLGYSGDDLRQIIDKLAGVYEGVKEFSDFIQMTTVRNNRTGIVEDCFKYMTRHTVGRPRDLVILCGRLSETSGQMSEDIFRRTVNDTAANTVVRNVFSEMGMFLECLKSKLDREHFFRLVPYNILVRSEITAIAREFTLFGAAAPADESSNCAGELHPFCELWSCGLLGVVSEDYMRNGVMSQRFKQPHESGFDLPRSLPVAEYYMLHPSLHATVKTQRGGDGYKMYSCIEIGHGCPWYEYNAMLIDLQRDLFKVSAEHRRARDIIEAALPYIHTMLSDEGRSVVRMPPTTHERFQRACEELENCGYHDLYAKLSKVGMRLVPAKASSKPRGKALRNPRKKRT